MNIARGNVLYNVAAVMQCKCSLLLWNMVRLW